MKTFLLRNLCILNHQHCIKASGKRTSLEPLQVKHAVTQISLIRYFGSASNQTDCKYFETITSSEFISSTQVCFKRHSAKCLYVANVQSPLQSSNWSANILNLIDHFGSCQFLPTSNFVSAMRICHSKLQLFCASCAGLAD